MLACLHDLRFRSSSLLFAAISGEICSLLVCIQDSVAVKDGDHFATVYGV
jgi:hypothetical protein